MSHPARPTFPAHPAHVYRLAETSDPVLASIRDAVSHALGEADTVRKDAGRLYEKTGCCAPAMMRFVQRSSRAGNQPL